MLWRILFNGIVAIKAVRRDYHKKERKKNQIQLRCLNTLGLRFAADSNPTKVTFEEVDMNDIVFEEQLGSGGFGVVYRGTWKGREVACKVMHGN